MIPRYTLPEMGAIWSEENKFRKWLEVELAVCEVLAERGRIPRSALERIRANARVDLARIQEIERTTRHDVIAFLSAVAETVGPDARYIHYGLTSSDVVDTALALLLRDSADMLLLRLERLAEVLRRRAFEFKDTPMIGRTHGVHAEPITFGLKLALWYADTMRNRERLLQVRERIRVGKISGAVGTFAHLDPEVEEAVCRRLGLQPEPISSQIIPRDRHAEFLAVLALIASSLEKIALEIRHLHRTEVREAEEFFAEGQKGSSAMPHKRNPIVAEQICGLARVVRANLQAALENIALWHERDISHSSVERLILPESCILTDYLLHRTTELLDRLVVFPERMRANLEATRGVIFSGELLLALTERGLSREQAYEIVQRHALRAWDEGVDFRELVRADPEIRARLTSEDLDALFRWDRALRHVDAVFRRVFGETAARPEREGGQPS
ncbi:MAG: adenylosuccinate lyase [Blastocatellia bacterium]|nr:adenylosuccinate lyase [Blastocatellia bacterium]MCX7752804.1 adenylosuccinate lyase [Blastocatellia bacterium]MDW8167538.1 adenylosuccinate lyase [Acidobacteriota bacterium]